MVRQISGIPDAPTQFDRLIGADLKFISALFSEVMKAPTADEVDALIARYRDATAKQQRDLIVLLSVHPVAFSDGAWTFLADMARQSEDELRAVLFRMLSLADAARFGRILSSTGWSWDARAPLWTNHYGTGALIKAETGLPFDELAPRLAPWRVLEGARARGADPAETRLAAEILGHVADGPNNPGTRSGFESHGRQGGEEIRSLHRVHTAAAQSRRPRQPRGSTASRHGYGCAREGPGPSNPNRQHAD
ncbi:hypothetical protein SAMN05443247_11673 [Bradyrhizobium erythrophlei]|nr:hypothetical protein SAMN05443247_11673 [Bradyrhizobium erythrophlei]